MADVSLDVQAKVNRAIADLSKVTRALDKMTNQMREQTRETKRTDDNINLSTQSTIKLASVQELIHRGWSKAVELVQKYDQEITRVAEKVKGMSQDQAAMSLAAQLPAEEKNRRSHRGQALAQLLVVLTGSE